MDAAQSAEDVITFWFSAEAERHWFASTPEFDRKVSDKLRTLYEAAISGELACWRDTAEGRHALAILFDQVPRMIFRDTAQAYASDGLAREITQLALQHGDDIALAKDGTYQAFFYLPLMHQENLADQDRSVALYEAHGPEDSVSFARHHRDIIRRFGRFPHRNTVLGRYSTDAEKAYLTVETW